MSSFEQVIPVLVYRDLQSAHDFLVRAFGFEPGGVERDGDGNAVHAEVRIGGTTVWLHRVTAEHQLGSPTPTDTAGTGLVVHVSDVDEHFARARAAGAAIQYEPADQFYGQREYEARDPEGHRWWFATPLRPSGR
jgi:uncharacterized glyoxalase superfamily protein PhnB